MNDLPRILSYDKINNGFVQSQFEGLADGLRRHGAVVSASSMHKTVSISFPSTMPAQVYREHVGDVNRMRALLVGAGWRLLTSGGPASERPMWKI